jgi:chaperonin GroEL
MTSIYNRKILYSEECREKIMEGISGLADAVCVTLGPKGKNVVIKHGYHDPQFTKDGVTVARNVFFQDEFKNLGAEIISGVALRTGARCGDGTTSATVIARALLTVDGPIVQSEVDAVIAALRASAIPVKTKQDWHNVAFVSANGDEGIANLISDTLEVVGMDGQITVELSSETGLKSDIVSGMSFQKGYASPYFVTNTEKMVAELDNSAIIVMDKYVHNLGDVFQYLNELVKIGRSVLIIAREVGGEALSTLVLNKVKNGAKVVAVSAGNLSNDFLEDIAIATGASLTEQKFGSAKKVIVSQDKTIIIEGAGDRAQIEERCTMLRDNKLKDRLARLSGGVALLKVGGNTEAEASERRDRVEDALGATRSAIEEGIVAGGGAALLQAGKLIPEGAVRSATEAPVRQILKNAGLELRATDYSDTQGYDARNMRLCNLIECGIVDPVKVVCSAFSDAVSVAALVRNTECGIVELVENKNG